MGLDAPWHWVVLALIVVALFGYKRMPEMARSVAQSLRVFKSEIKGISAEPTVPSPVPPVAIVADPNAAPPSAETAPGFDESPRT